MRYVSDVHNILVDVQLIQEVNKSELYSDFKDEQNKISMAFIKNVTLNCSLSQFVSHTRKLVPLFTSHTLFLRGKKGIC